MRTEKILRHVKFPAVMGRPRKRPQDIKGHRIMVRLSEAQYKILRAISDMYGSSDAETMRYLILQEAGRFDD